VLPTTCCSARYHTRFIKRRRAVVGRRRHYYRAIQEGLAADGNDWVSLHRNFSPAEREHIAGDYNGTNEVSMRGQYRAWARFMSGDPSGSNA
jgi:hypothetical protein